MSGRSAKAARRDERERLVEHIAQAHDRLHKGDVEEAHELLHQALGSGEIDATVRPLSHRDKFDRAFRDLCVRHAVAASYILVDEIGGDGRARLLSGGDALLTSQLDEIFQRAVS